MCVQSSCGVCNYLLPNDRGREALVHKLTYEPKIEDPMTYFGEHQDPEDRVHLIAVDNVLVHCKGLLLLSV